MKYTLITGACGGLGRAFVTLCARNKENLILTGTSEKKLTALSAEFAEEFKGLDVKTFVCDLSKLADRENLVKNITEQKLEVSRLINNAGLIIEGDLERYTDEEIASCTQINCVGTLDLTKKLLESRNKQELMEVLTVSSIASFYPIPHFAVYAATKAFLTSMMTSLAIEYKKQNVVFTTTCPGGMATNDNMKESIKSMGFGGKLSTLDTIKVAKISLRALKKRKTVVVPGFFNKFLCFLSKFPTKKFLAKNAGKIYAKSHVFIIFLKMGLTKIVI